MGSCKKAGCTVAVENLNRFIVLQLQKTAERLAEEKFKIYEIAVRLALHHNTILHSVFKTVWHNAPELQEKTMFAKPNMEI